MVDFKEIRAQFPILDQEILGIRWCIWILQASREAECGD